MCKAACPGDCSRCSIGSAINLAEQSLGTENGSSFRSVEAERRGYEVRPNSEGGLAGSSFSPQGRDFPLPQVPRS